MQVLTIYLFIKLSQKISTIKNCTENLNVFRKQKYFKIQITLCYNGIGGKETQYGNGILFFNIVK